jgi:transcriptional regulator with XRE-family HTH domain
MQPGKTGNKAPNQIDRHLGNTIRMRRIMIGLTQEGLAEALGISFQQIQRYERGLSRISASRLQHLANILQVPIEFFFDGVSETKGAQSDVIAQFLATSEGLSLIKAFTIIQKPRLKRRIVDLVESIADYQNRSGK